jgi:tripartite-type tricarboxylate transporter receptor subunit TctC
MPEKLCCGLRFAVCGLAGLWGANVSAQIASDTAMHFPNKPIRIVIPYAAGGPPDGAARVVADKLTQGWGQNFVFDNRGGGGGVTGANIVAKAAPDGYSVLVHAVGSPGVGSVVQRAGVDGIGSSPQELTRTVIEDMAMNKALTARIGIVPQ